MECFGAPGLRLDPPIQTKRVGSLVGPMGVLSKGHLYKQKEQEARGDC